MDKHNNSCEALKSMALWDNGQELSLSCWRQGLNLF